MERDIILFAGQGSGLRYDKTHVLSTSSVALDFVKACLQVLNEELNSLTAEDKLAIQRIIHQFRYENDLIEPTVQDHPVVQGVVLYIHQILDLIAYTETNRNDDSRISETVGVCSGILPAVISSLCSCSDPVKFLRVATTGLRIAFWVGLRVNAFCHRLRSDKTKHFAWSLTIQGLGMSEVEELLAEYNSSEQPTLPLRIVAILSEQVITIAGEGGSLQKLAKERMPARARSRFANIHGYYHGGENMESLVNEVLKDVERRDIEFPGWGSLRFAVRSAMDGNCLTRQTSSMSLLETILDHILVKRVDWRTTATKLMQETLERINLDVASRCRVLAMGPNSKSLLRAMDSSPTNARLRVVVFDSKPGDGPQPDDIAIVGISINYPSGKNLDSLWEVLENRLNLVEEIPSTRFAVADYFDKSQESNKRPRKMTARHGNFLKDPFAFDNNFFHISPREARSMDPQQRLLLHAALEALEDSGYSPDSTPSFQRDTVGVFVGVATEDYLDNTRHDIDVYYSPGTLRAFLSGRISYAFQFGGPSVVIDTACSSSTVALYQACRALQSGDCTTALAGGVNVISSPDMYLGLSRAHFLSSTGQCKPFDASADGYCRGEGCGLFVLKRLCDAVAEGDRIYGVIRGIEVNQCGNAKSITHPDATTQAKLFKSLLSKTKIDPNSISVVEAHGTGTQAGDFAEVNSLQSALGTNRPQSKKLILSSIKGNIGHAEAASGSAGLAKLLLMMQKKRIPPQAAHTRLNPRLESMLQHNIVVPTNVMEWTTTGVPRRALLNNFGAAGSNVALILEEFSPLPSKSIELPARSCHVLKISAKTADALEILRKDYCAYLKSVKTDSELLSLCYSANARRQDFDAFRIIASGSSSTDLLRTLEQTQAPSRRTATSAEPLVVFVFSGQGSIYAGMGAELFVNTPVFRNNVLLCNTTLQDLGFPTTEAYIGGNATGIPSVKSEDHIVISQCACFIVEYCLAQLWISFGVVPDMVIGHSLGEYAALATAGVLSLRDALLLVASRAKLMTDLCAEDATGMVACNLAPSDAEALVSRLEGVTVACKNSATDSVVAGPIPSLKRFVAACKDSGHKAKMLDVPFAFHSAAMEPILEPFAQVVAGVTIHAPKIPLVSSYLGKSIVQNDICIESFVGHARQPVEFIRAAHEVVKFGDHKEVTFLEIGPAPITLPSLKATLNQATAAFVASLRPKESSWTTMSSALSSLFLRRLRIKWREVYAGLPVHFLANIPRYPLNPTSFVVPFVERTGITHAEESVPLSPTWRFLDGSKSTNDTGLVFRSKVSALAEFIKAHNVGGSPLCPASVYIELALEASLSVKAEQGRYHSLTNISFDKPLVYSKVVSDKDIFTEIATTDLSVRILSDEGANHFSGSLATLSDDRITQDLARRASYIKRQRGSIVFKECLSRRMIYDIVFVRVVAYSDPYISIKELSIAPSGLEAFGSFQIPASGHDGFVCPPVFTDTLLHAAGFVANTKIRSNEVCICVKVDRIIVPSSLVDSAIYQEMGIYCDLLEYTDEYIIGDAYALDGNGSIVACAEGIHFKKLRLESFKRHLAHMVTKPGNEHQGSVIAPASNQNKLGSERRSGSSSISTIGVVSPQAASEKIPDLGGMRSNLYQCISEVCGVSRDVIRGNTNLSDIGVDSLMMIELTTMLQRQCSTIRLHELDLERCENVEQIEELLKSLGTLVVDHAPSGDRTPDLSTGKSTPRSDTSASPQSVERLNEFFQRVCGLSLQEVDKTMSLASFGVDSLLSIELVSELNRAFGIQVDDSVVCEMSVDALEDVILSKGTESPMQQKTSAVGDDHIGFEPDSSILNEADVAPSCLQVVDKIGAGTAPLYLFHDGSGLCKVYSRIAHLGREVWGVPSIDFLNVDRSITTLEELASRYITQLKLAEKEKVILGGWSFGGVLAFEVSRQLRNCKPTAVKGVILIDSPPPISHEPLPDVIVSHICERMPAHTPGMQRVRRNIEAQFKRNARLLGSYNPPLSNAVDTSRNVSCIMLKCKNTFDMQGLCDIKYGWLDDDKFRETSTKAWEDLVGGAVPVLDIDGNHFDVFSPANIKSASKQLEKASYMLDRNE
ncbi:polyketide beta-ketoacyl-synthase [Coniothyrium glycines]